MSGDPPAAGSYVYGVTVAGSAPPPVDGIGARPAVRLVASGPLAALVSDAERDEVAAGAKALRAHARVLDAAIEEGPVVPLRFGTLVGDDRAVVDDVLAPHHDRLAAMLEELGPRVELAVRARYDEDAVVAAVVAADPAIARLHERMAGVDPEATYYQRIELGERIGAAVDARRAADADELLAALEELAADVSLADLLDPHMVLNASFLVDRAEVPAFDAQVRAAAAAHPEMAVRYVGPLPPYSFADPELTG
ncbi:MAG TPA: GvpL/GvpF family gas vesicle protein [Acidimicrobiales bacterium]|jgi:hypothetical protein|nr:GvpL/GvpF family gas vesicle protein [Acidimicrobiales bacterium]